MAKAIGLFSGGLDSVLAVLLLQKLGVEVLPITFSSPFFNTKKTLAAADKINISVRILDITDPLIEILRNPEYGFGKNMNPCVDCHALMLNEAGKLMEKEGFDFLFTGEVLNERPMSQTMSALTIVAKKSGYADYILRPLSAKRLPQTKPEREGLVDRSQLLDFCGRSRKPQIALAEEFGVTQYENPAGGCLLTYEGYSLKLRDLLKHTPGAPLRQYDLLRMGRHFRLPCGNKLIVGKDKNENEFLLSQKQAHDIVLQGHNIKSPIGLIPCPTDSCDFDTACRIIARYCKPDTRVPIELTRETPALSVIKEVTKFSPEESDVYLITV